MTSDGIAAVCISDLDQFIVFDSDLNKCSSIVDVVNKAQAINLSHIVFRKENPREPYLFCAANHRVIHINADLTKWRDPNRNSGSLAIFCLQEDGKGFRGRDFSMKPQSGNLDDLAKLLNPIDMYYPPLDLKFETR